MILCDQGAEVIKVEPTGSGDSMRYLGTQKGGISAIFSNCNRGKQSLNLDLKDKDERKILLELVKEADVFISNYRPGVNERLGLGLDVLRNINPHIIYVSISGLEKRDLWQMLLLMITLFKECQVLPASSQMVMSQRI